MSPYSPPGSLFELTPDDGIALVGIFDTSTPALTLLGPDGELLLSDVPLSVNPELLSSGGPSPFVSPSSVAVDQDGNIIVRSSRVLGMSSLPNLVQRVLPLGEVDTSFGLDGGVLLGNGGFGDIIFDSEGRLVFGDDDLSRFEFV